MYTVVSKEMPAVCGWPRQH